jgi:hypothetical protein
VDEKDVQLFVKSRNKLIHTGHYYCEAATEEERVTTPPLENRFEEYKFIINFIDRVFLKIFQYSGEYNNIRKYLTERSLKDYIY